MRRWSKRKRRRMLGWALVLLLAALLPLLIRALRASLAEKQTPEALLASPLHFEDLLPFDGALTLELGSVSLSPDALPPEPTLLLSELDALGRTGPALAVVGEETLCYEPRGRLGDILPAGFQNVRYDDLIEDHYLYNRCHLIAYQLCGVNAEARLLFTGTRALNVDGMLPVENALASFVRRSGLHVLYRAAPVYCGSELVPRGVELEAVSMEDGGEGLRLHVFVWNVQPGIAIDYRDGSSRRE